MTADKEKVKTICDWLTPCTMTDMRSFHELATFYRCFIYNFSSIVALLIDCLKKEKFQRSPEQDKKFALIKEKLTVVPCLVGKLFVVT